MSGSCTGGYGEFKDTTKGKGSEFLDEGDEGLVFQYQSDRGGRGGRVNDGGFGEGGGEDGEGGGGVERVGLREGEGLESGSLGDHFVRLDGGDEGGGGGVEEVQELVGEGGELGGSSNEDDLWSCC